MTDNDSPSQGASSGKDGSVDAIPGARLSWLKVNRFRHVKLGTELRFDEGINVLLGRNGTGKTTLLELIVAVLRGDLRAYQKESFELEFELRLTGEVLVIWVENTISANEVPPQVFGRDTRASGWSYRIDYHDRNGVLYQIEAMKGRTTLDKAVHPESSLFTPSFVEECISLVLGIPLAVVVGFRYGGLQLASGLIRLDEGLDIFKCITEGHMLPLMGRPLTATLFEGFPWGNPVESMRKVLRLIASYVPAALLEHLLERGDGVHKMTEVTVSSDQWQLLDNLRQLLGAQNFQVTLQLIERKEAGNGQLRSGFGKPIFRVTTREGTTYTHDQLSYGEKRLLAFLYHAAANPQILVADELVNGLHHEWIQTCLDAIQGQAFLTSQNPLLLDHLPFSSADEVQRRFVLCDRDEHGNWTWRNMDSDEASSFYRAYDVGVQHVSGILRTKGLW